MSGFLLGHVLTLEGKIWRINWEELLVIAGSITLGVAMMCMMALVYLEANKQPQKDKWNDY